ncbi:MAG: helix-turn-helix domain-containing protein [Thermoanaerobaculia bacterium]|nr:helix-turn-helix domain-containing protein [Thermoanaerobaculia bacterium]
MDLEKAACVKATLSRDGRFAGRFFVGVVTTRVYCRPGCPAPLPKAKNMRFYAYAAAAEDAGFRPCRRCRPETAPGSPVWNGTSATVSRALKRIFDGDGHESVETLAARLGLGSRHLRRLFAEHVGASPASLQRTHRVHFARRLLDETSLPAAEVAFASGFESVRRFNDAIRATFHRTPTELRGRNGIDARSIRLRLPIRPPFDATSLFSFLEERALPGVEAVRGHAYSRTIESRGTPGVLTLSKNVSENFLVLSLSLPPGSDLLDIVRRAGRLFDVDADPLAIADVLGRDPLLAPLVAARPGLRVPGAWDPFELSVRAILGQQVSVRGARTLAGRLVAGFGRTLPGGGADGLTHLFPAPAALAAADLSGIGVPAARAAAIRTLAAAVNKGRLELTAERGLEDFETRLCALPGIGPWTAQYVALRAFGEPDAFPAGDLGLRRALEAARVPADAAALRERALSWSPFRAYATLHLWSSLAADAGSRKDKETR